MTLSLSLLLGACKSKDKTLPAKANYPDWAKNTVIYEVNVRQYTPEGTFKAFEAYLPRLKDLGVDILWIMPINPIGEKNRKIPEGFKSSLGSYYSVRDYKAVNPEFGTADDFHSLVSKAHGLGMKVIIDWVANHTAWDNAWLTDHPDWYKKDSTGKFVSPFDWTDVVSLNYDNRDMRKAMMDAMCYWVKEYDIDGFRCDVAGLVPVDFWEEARAEIQKTKPVFMLAEDECNNSMCKKAFDMGYAWKLHSILHNVAQGKDSLASVRKYQKSLDSVFATNAIKMNFLTNHDENSWNGTVREKFGDAEKAFAVFTYTYPGMPLIYTGQEANLTHRLQFFVKDSINWADTSLFSFYKSLNALKHANVTLSNPPFGGSLEWLRTTADTKVLAFARIADGNTVITLLNPFKEKVAFDLKSENLNGTYTRAFDKTEVKISGNDHFELPAFGYQVFVR